MRLASQLPSERFSNVFKESKLKILLRYKFCSSKIQLLHYSGSTQSHQEKIGPSSRPIYLAISAVLGILVPEDRR